MSGDAPAESPAHRESLRDYLSRRPTLIFVTIMVVAAIIYSYRLGTDALGASEAYSAAAAAKPSVGAIVRIPVMHDPGKQVFYYVVLHFFTLVFGLREVALRSMSVVLALVTLVMIFAVGREMFDEATAVAGVAIWAFNPLAVVFAHLARMYPMFITVALAHLWTLWRLRRNPSTAGAIVCGGLGAAMPYTHLAGMLIVGAEAAMLVRDWVRGRRDSAPWLALCVTIVLFVPYVPTAASQSRDLVYGHSLDYLGTPYDYSLAAKLIIALLAAIVSLWLVFGRKLEPDSDEPIRWLLSWLVIPGLAFLTGSVIVHPMFNPRYLAPEIAASAVLIAGSISIISPKWRNLVTASIALVCLMTLPFDRTEPQPWREIARQVGRSGAAEPVFFEAGFVSNSQTADIPNTGFPFGYYSVPFDYYFNGTNPRIAIPSFDPASARATLEERISSAGGGWLISWKEDGAIDSELPDPKRFHAVEKLRAEHLAFYRITPVGK